MVVVSIRASVKITTRQSTLNAKAIEARGLVGDTATRRGTARIATTTSRHATAHATVDNTAVSASNWQTRRPRLAPSARQT